MISAPGFNPLMQHFLGVLQRPPSPPSFPGGSLGGPPMGGAFPVSGDSGMPPPTVGPRIGMRPPQVSQGYGGSVFDAQPRTGMMRGREHGTF